MSPLPLKVPRIAESRFTAWVLNRWYGPHPIAFLKPFASLFEWSVQRRRKAYSSGRKQVKRLPVPVIVVGNIVVGGAGKTPTVLAVVDALKHLGYRPAILSRGYGAHPQHPRMVTAHSTPSEVGDEPVLLFRHAGVPLAVGVDRFAAGQLLLRQHPEINCIVSDDGLQHYALPRALEIVVIDGMRGMGSGLCLPAGPLREPIHRLQQVNFIVVNGQQTVHTQFLPCGNVYNMTLEPTALRSFNGTAVNWKDIKMPCSALAGIGHPERFFKVLKQLGVVFEPHKFADHHEFLPADLANLRKPIIMTEKDAVKCCAFATDAMYYLPVEAKLSDEFWTQIWGHIKGLI